MIINRRTLLAMPAAFVPALAARPVVAGDVPSFLTDYERASGGKIGVYAENVRTSATFVWRANERFVMCSTFKASVAACILARVDRGEDRLDQMISYGPKDILDYAPVAQDNLARGALSIADLCKGAVELSDNTCANLLLRHLGGPVKLTAFWRALGDTTSRLDHYEPELNRSPPGDPHDTTTPAAMAGDLKRLVLGDALSQASRDRLTGWLVNCKTGDKRLRGGLPKDWRIGDKTGNNGADAVSDIAVAWPRPDVPIVIAVYTQGGKPSSAQHEQMFAAIGYLIAARLG